MFKHGLERQTRLLCQRNARNRYHYVLNRLDKTRLKHLVFMSNLLTLRILNFKLVIFHFYSNFSIIFFMLRFRVQKAFRSLQITGKQIPFSGRTANNGMGYRGYIGARLGHWRSWAPLI